MSSVQHVTVQAFTPNDPLAVTLAIVCILILAAAFFVANHNLKDRF